MRIFGLRLLLWFADRVLDLEWPRGGGQRQPPGDAGPEPWTRLLPGLRVEVARSAAVADFAPTAGTSAAGAAAAGPAGLAAAVAAAIPTVISLFTSTTTVKDHREDITSLATTTAVVAALARALPRYTVAHEDFRLAPERSEIRDNCTRLAARRAELVIKQATVQADKNTADLELFRAQQRRAAAPEWPGLGQGDAADQLNQAKATTADAAAMLSLISAAVSAVDAFSTAVNAIAAGARSPLAVASLSELLRRDVGDGIDYVLSVQGLGGQSEEYTGDRKVGFDTYTTVAEASISFMLYDTANRKIISSGLVNGVGAVHGRLGELPGVLIGPDPAAGGQDRQSPLTDGQQGQPNYGGWRSTFGRQTLQARVSFEHSQIPACMPRAHAGRLEANTITARWGAARDGSRAPELPGVVDDLPTLVQVPAC